MVRHLKYVNFHEVDEHMEDGWTIVPQRKDSPFHPVLDSRGVIMVKWTEGDED